MNERLESAAHNARAESDIGYRGRSVLDEARGDGASALSMATLKHELWESPEGLTTFCLAGPMGDEARRLVVEPGSRLVWVVEATSHFEAMTLYYEHMGWGPYTTEHTWDYQPYPDDWETAQRQGTD